MTSGIQRPLLCGPVRRPSDELPASVDADQSVHADAVLQDYVHDARPDQGRSDNAGQNEKYAVGRVKITEIYPRSSIFCPPSDHKYVYGSLSATKCRAMFASAFMFAGMICAPRIFQPVLRATSGLRATCAHEYATTMQRKDEVAKGAWSVWKQLPAVQ